MEWMEQLQFRFPQALGRMTEVLDTHISVNWDQHQQYVRGLYLIKAKVRFDLQPAGETQGILIEHFDLEDDVVYFEYGFPFEHSIAGGQIEKITVQHVEPQLADNLQLNWYVALQLQPNLQKELAVKQEVQEPVVKQEVQEPVLKQQIQEPVVKQEAQEPVVKRDIQEPVVKQEVQEAVVKEENQAPVVKQEVQKPVVKQETRKPVVKQEVQQPIVQQETQQSVMKQENQKAEDETIQLFDFKETFSKERIVLNNIGM